ncbi:MAG: hypothetical protein LBD41_04055 [Clostridiales Family XIII bacterium]|nr:hypothetical protein [Clostridiales Family XIII bacterium]
MFHSNTSYTPIVLPWKDIKESSTQITHNNEDKVHGDDCIEISSVMKNKKLDKREHKPEPTHKSNRSKKAISLCPNEFL